MLVEVVREDGVIPGIACVAGKAAVHAAVGCVADAIELRGVGNRQRAQQHGVDQ